jgi:tripartite-type tricarboxylate transporter receptor subunit TctC
VVVENRSSASGLIGMGEVARAASDGHTVLINAQAHTTLPATHGARIGYDAASAFIPVTSLGRTPLFVTVTPEPIVARLHAALAETLAAPDLRERIIASGSPPGGEPREAFAAFVAEEMATWARVVRETDIRIE